jgi:hypothetical protein
MAFWMTKLAPDRSEMPRIALTAALSVVSERSTLRDPSEVSGIAVPGPLTVISRRSSARRVHGMPLIAAELVAA